MASLYNYGTGRWGLPEMGLTEMFGGDKSSTAFASINKINEQKAQQYKPTSSGIVQGAQPNTNFTGGATYGTPNASYNTNSLFQDINRLGKIEADQIDSKARDFSEQIDSLYDAPYKTYKSRLGEVPQMESELMGQAQSGYDAQRKGIEYGQGVQLGRLDQNLGEVDTMQKEGSRNIAQDTIASMNAANQKLGAFGASDSSASNMYGYAIGKQANKMQTQLLNTLNKQRGEIQLKKQEVVADAQNKLSQAENWLQTKKVEIAQYVRQIRNGIKDAMSELDSAKKNQKLEVLMDAYNKVSSRTQQLNNIYLQARANVLQSTQASLADIGQYENYLAERFSANPEQPQLGSIDTGGQLGTNQRAFAPVGVGDNTDEKQYRLGLV